MYYKILNSKLYHRGFQYQLGLNVDTNLYDHRECSNGLHFADIGNIAKWLDYGAQLAYVTIPADATSLHFKDKSKANKIFIEKIIPLVDWEMWSNEEFCLTAVKQNGLALQFVKNQTDEICLEAVKQNGFTLQFVKNQTNEICLEAVSKYGGALKYVNIQTEEICMKAVAQQGSSLCHVKNQTDEICLAAVKQNGFALTSVHIQTDEICLAAVKQDGYVLNYVHNQTEEICVAAVKQYRYAWLVIKDLQMRELCKTIC